MVLRHLIQEILILKKTWFKIWIFYFGKIQKSLFHLLNIVILIWVQKFKYFKRYYYQLIKNNMIFIIRLLTLNKLYSLLIFYIQYFILDFMTLFFMTWIIPRHFLIKLLLCACWLLFFILAILFIIFFILEIILF